MDGADDADPRPEEGDLVEDPYRPDQGPIFEQDVGTEAPEFTPGPLHRSVPAEVPNPNIIRKRNEIPVDISAPLSPQMKTRAQRKREMEETVPDNTPSYVNPKRNKEPLKQLSPVVSSTTEAARRRSKKLGGASHQALCYVRDLDSPLAELGQRAELKQREIPHAVARSDPRFTRKGGAIDRELESWKQNQVHRRVKGTQGEKPISARMVYTEKGDEDGVDPIGWGKIAKARLVVRGCFD